MSVSDESVFTRAFTSLMFTVDRVHPPYCYRCPLGLRAGDLSDRLPGRPREDARDARRRRGRRARRADAAGRRRDDHVAGGIPRRRPQALRSARRADDRRRSADRVRPHRPHVRLRARSGDARHHLPVEGADGRIPAARRHGGDRRGLRRLPQRRSQQDVLPRPLVHGQPAGVRGGASRASISSRRTTCSRASRGSRPSFAPG